MVDALSEIDRYILVARLNGYLLQHTQAVEILTDALAEHPDDMRLLYHRGTKRIISRDLKGAISDLERAVDQISTRPDQIEFYRNEVLADITNLILGNQTQAFTGSPLMDHDSLAATSHLAKGTLHAGTWYNLGMARYLTGDFFGSASAFAAVYDVQHDEYLAIAAANWRYMALRRGQDKDGAEAALTPLKHIILDDELVDSPNVPNSLKRCYIQLICLYRGELQPQDLLRNDLNSPLAAAALDYGVANWYLYQGMPGPALRCLQRVIDFGTPESFSYVAAEVDLQNFANIPR